MQQVSNNVFIARLILNIFLHLVHLKLLPLITLIEYLDVFFF